MWSLAASGAVGRRVFLQLKWVFHLLSKQPKQERQKQTRQQAGHDWEMETEIAFGVVNITGQPAQPAFAKAGP